MSCLGTLPSVDAAAIRCYWGGLSFDEQLRLVHFEDRALVEKVAHVQTDLCNSDLLCFKLGIRGQDGVRQEVGMDQWLLECEATARRTPVAFYAKPEFLEKTDLFNYIEQRLGRPFLLGRPVVQRKDWSSLLEPHANSWKVFMNQVLELVELVIFEAHQHAMATELPEVQELVGTRADGVGDESRQPLLGPLFISEQKTQSPNAKRRARKKMSKSGASGSLAHGDLNSLPDKPAMIDGVEDSTVDGSTVEYSTEAPETDDLSSICSSRDSSMRPVPEYEICLNFDWNPEGPPIDETTESAAVELQVDWGDDNNLQSWSAWLPNGNNGSQAEWHWTTKGPPCRAFLKNTFVETADGFRSDDDERPRPRSLPARVRPVHL